MNKKLFFAGFALLAAVSFTSCSTDTPIDITNPNGVAPDGSHAIGGAYDWTVTPKNVKQLDSLWNVDKAKVQANIKDSKTASICINVDNFTLENNKTIEIPELWSTGTKAVGKVVSVTVSGNFKNADFERVDAIKNAATPAKQTKFPVLIDTKNLAGAEVDFDFEVEKFDLYLTTPLARSILSGNYTIGYMIAAAAETLSATEFKSGTVEGLDYFSTGDFKGEIAGVWVNNPTAATWVGANAKGIQVGSNPAYTVFGKNIFVESDIYLDTWYVNNAGEDAQFEVGTVTYKKAATVHLDGWKTIAGTAGVDAIESVKGYKAADCKLQAQGGLSGADLSKIKGIEKVTVQWVNLVLTEDVYTDVVFNSNVRYKATDIPTIDKVEFAGTLNLIVPDDNTAIAFNGVKFDVPPVTISSSKQVENTVAVTTSRTYQWIVSPTAANGGYYEEYGGNTGKSLTEYNKNEEVKEFAYTSPNIKLYFAAGDFTGADAATAKQYKVVKRTVTTPAGKITLIPEGTTVTMDKDCKFASGATTDAALNIMWGNKEYWDEQCWYSVSYAGNDYVWKKATDTTGTSASGVWFVLVKK